MPLTETAKAIAGAHADPNDLFIVGIDTPPEGCPTEPLPDGRGLAPKGCTDLEDAFRNALSPPDFLIESIMVRGVVSHVAVRTIRYKSAGVDHRLKVLLDGRMRVRACREANVRLQKKGDDHPWLVGYYIKQAAPEDDLVVVLSNSGRTIDPVSVRGQKIVQLRTRGYSDAKILSVMSSDTGRSVTAQTIRNWANLAKLPAEIQAAVDAGTCPMTGALELTKLGSHAAMLDVWKASLPGPAAVPPPVAPPINGAPIDPMGDAAHRPAGWVPPQPVDPLPPPRKAPARALSDAARSAAGQPPAPARKRSAATGEGMPVSARQLAELSEKFRPDETYVCDFAACDQEHDSARHHIDRPWQLLSVVLAWASGAEPLRAVQEIDPDAYKVIVSVVGAPAPAAPPRPAKGADRGVV